MLRTLITSSLNRFNASETTRWTEIVIEIAEGMSHDTQHALSSASTSAGLLQAVLPSAEHGELPRTPRADLALLALEGRRFVNAEHPLTHTKPRLRDVPPEDQFMGGRGQSYRPGGDRPRSPPRSDNYRARSPPRREREREPVVDSYAPSRGPTRGRSRSPPRGDSYRRRSPSPRGYRDAPRGADSYRARPRSPPRREELPRDDLFRREPPRDYREDDRYARRSPPRYRDRSPLPLKRGREPSLDSRGRRTPPPSKRERLASPPRGRYDDYSRPPRYVVQWTILLALLTIS